MDLSNATLVADFGSGIGTEGSVLQIDTDNKRLGIGIDNPQAILQVATGVTVYGNSGIVSATSFYGDASNITNTGSSLDAASGSQRVVVTSQTSGTMTAAATNGDLLFNASTNTLSAENIAIGGTLTYGDATNTDSVGIITARTGIKVLAGGINAVGVVTATSFSGDGSTLSGVEFGAVNFVASGTISNGATVIIKDDGTVGIVTQTTSDTPSAGTPVKVDTSSFSSPQEHNACAYDSTNQKVVIVYKDADNSYYGTAVVGTVSGTSISFGTAVEFNSAEVGYTATVYDTTNDKIVIAYQDSANSNYGTAIVGTVSGTSISFGSEEVFESATVDSGMTAAYVGSGKVVMAYRDAGNSYKGTAIVGTVSGTSISFGASAVFDSGPASITFISATYDSTNDKVAIAYRDNFSPNYGYAVVGTVSGTDITFGSVVLMTAADTRTIFTTYDSTNDRVIVCYRDSGNSSYGTAIVGTVVGTAITFGSEVVFNSGTTTQIGCTFDSTNGKTVIAFSDDSNSSYGTAVVFSSTSQQTNLTATNYIGIAGEAISNAATGKINIIGGTNTGQSGLTTSQTYYIGQTGILTTTADTPSVVAGTSISDTKILVWKS